MKKTLTFTFAMFLSIVIFAQSPQAVCYQAVATDAAGVELQSRNISVRSTLLQGSMDGTVVTQEVYAVTTDEFGLFNLEIGQGNAMPGTPDFENINWAQGPFFLKMEMDPLGGTNFISLGTSQILSVPYAIYSEKSNASQNSINAQNAVNADVALMADTAVVALTTLGDNDTSPDNELQNLVYDASTGVLSITNTTEPGVLINTDDADANPANELQDLEYDATTGELSLTLAEGPSVTIDVDDEDADPENEFQQLSFENNILTISGENGNSIDFGAELFGAPGASSDFPQGIVGQHIVLKTGTYTVPANKTFYLTASGNTVDFLTPSNITITHPTTPNMPVFGPNTAITDCRCTGMLVDFSENIVPAVLDLTTANDTYTVPPGFILFLKSGISNSMTGTLKIDGDDMEFLRPNFTRGSRIISFPEGTNIQRPTNSDPGAYVLTGYLIAVPN